MKATEKSHAGEGTQKGKTGHVSPEPTTPDAMAHMPEQMKTEYKRLKEQLALHESKTRQPLTTVNQEKGNCNNVKPTSTSYNIQGIKSKLK